MSERKPLPGEPQGEAETLAGGEGAAERVAHALLLSLRPGERLAEERRVARVLAAVETQGATRVYIAGSPGFRGVVRWAVAAMVAVAGVVWLAYEPGPTGWSIVQQAIAASEAGVDRVYRIMVERRGGAGPVEAELTVRGSRQFVLRVWGLRGEVSVGSDGERFWLRGPMGRVIERDELPARLEATLAEDGVELPLLSVDAVLRRLERGYELTRLEDETTAEGAAVRRVVGEKTAEEARWPARVELWSDAATGAARRLVLTWPADAEAGPRSATIELAEERPWGADYFAPPAEW